MCPASSPCTPPTGPASCSPPTHTINPLGPFEANSRHRAFHLQIRNVFVSRMKELQPLPLDVSAVTLEKLPSVPARRPKLL